VAQDAFLKAYRNIAEFHGESSFYTWIYRITVNVVLSRRRYQAVRPKAVEPLAGHDGSRALDPPGAAHVEPVEMAHRRDLQRLVEQAILRLDDESRALIVLRDIEGRNYEEIAEILDCPRGTVKSRLHRARCALRDLLKAALPAGPEI
jgi:RNA polymerase sigma-70 factor (ECF subfamily)